MEAGQSSGAALPRAGPHSRQGDQGREVLPKLLCESNDTPNPNSYLAEFERLRCTIPHLIGLLAKYGIHFMVYVATYIHTHSTKQYNYNVMKALEQGT